MLTILRKQKVDLNGKSGWVSKNKREKKDRSVAQSGQSTGLQILVSGVRIPVGLPTNKRIIMKILPLNFYTMPSLASTTMETKDLKELLLGTDGWIMANGRIWNIKDEHLGAGVYKVTLELKN